MTSYLVRTCELESLLDDVCVTGAYILSQHQEVAVEVLPDYVIIRLCGRSGDALTRVQILDPVSKNALIQEIDESDDNFGFAVLAAKCLGAEVNVRTGEPERKPLAELKQE